MNTRIIFFALLAMCELSLVQAADLTRGKYLVDRNCVSCHGTQPYTSQKRAVQTLQALQKQVHMCVHAQNLNWDDSAIDDVVTYLNEKFYHVK